MLKKWEKIRYLGYDPQILASCRPSMDIDNLRVLRGIGWLLLGLLAILIGFYTLFDYEKTRNLICVATGILLIILLFFCHILLEKPALRTTFRVDLLINSFSGLAFAVGIYLGTFAAENDLAVASVWMFFFVILIFNRFPMQNFFVLFIAGTTFIICSFITKDAYVFSYDAMHAFMSIAASIYMAWTKSQIKVENILSLDRLQNANLEILETVEEQQREAALLRHRASRDELTGLYKRNAFETAVADSIKSNPHGTYALICADVDDFKDINDSFGHMVGDTVLKEITEAIRKALPEDCAIGRFGGDEFLAFIECSGDTKQLAAQLDTMLLACCLTYSIKNISKTVSLSAGVSLYPHDGTSYKALFEKADKSLYRAKSEGKGRLFFFHHGI